MSSDGPMWAYGMQGGAYRKVHQNINDMLSAGSTNPKYAEFKNKYKYDPVGFAQDCIIWPRGEGLTEYQIRILRALVDHKRVAVRGPHGMGKSAIASIFLLWFALTRDGDDWKVPTTASAWQQLTRFLWPEVKKWRQKLNWSIIGRAPFDTRTEALVRTLNLETGQSFPLASSDSANMEGAHADHLGFIFDESKNIPDATFDALEGAFSGAGEGTGREAYALAISTPGDTSGRFFQIHKREPGYEDWHCIHVTLQDTIKAGRVDQGWADSRKRQWGEKSALYQNRVLGEFCADDEDGLIPLAWIEAANLRWVEWAQNGKKGRMTGLGLDCGRGGDKSVFAPCYDTVYIDNLQSLDNKTLQPIQGRAKALLEKHEGCKLVVDAIGLGAGVADQQEENGFEVVRFVASHATTAKDKSELFSFRDVRGAAWWKLREALDPASDPVIALPPDDQLIGDLTTPRWKVIGQGKIAVESKEDIRKRLKRSTDSGDAVVQVLTGIDLAKMKPMSSWA